MAPKVGIYNNHISNNFQAYLGNALWPTRTTAACGNVSVNSSTDAVSFLTQVDVGVDWKFAASGAHKLDIAWWRSPA